MKLTELWRRLLFLTQRKRCLEELEEEMRFHAELRARANASQNTPAEQAAAAAQRQFGNRTSFKESVWNLWTFTTLENAWRDLVFGARVLRSNPGFTIIAVLTLAIGIGATTAMFSVIDNVLIEPFPYAHQQRLFSLIIHDATSNEPGGRTIFPAIEFLGYKQQNRVFDDVMGVAISRALWTTGAAPESVNAPLVTPNAFEFLGVPALLGRVSKPSDVRPGSPPVCVMSYAFWKSRFAGDLHVLGKTLTLDGTARTVIGVMPQRFVFWSADVWLPTALRPETNGFPPPWYYLLARLKEGVSVSAAQLQLQAIAERLATKYRPDLYTRQFNVNLQSFADSAIGKFRRTIFTLLAAVGLLLLIACANVANLLLARVSARKKELAVRTSLGAGWWRIVRQLFLESALLAFVGTALGCAFAVAGLKVLMAALPPDTFPDEALITLNTRVLLATIAVTIATAIFFGLVPMLGGLRQDVNDALKSAGRQHSAFRRSQFRNLLIVAEVAVSLVLLSAAGVMMRSFLHEREVQLGIAPQHVLSAEVFLNKGHRTVDQQARFNHDLTNALRRVPGVLDVASTTDFLPFGGAPTQFVLPGRPRSEDTTGGVAIVDPGIFRTLQVPFLKGRNLTEIDAADKHMVAVVNRTLAEKYFRGKDPVGQRIYVTTLAHIPQPLANPWFEIVGVVSDFKNRGLRQPAAPEIFVPYTVAALGGFAVDVRTVGEPQALGKTLEGIALTLDPSTVVRHIRTLQDTLESEAYAKPRFGLEIFSVFATLGVLLVSAGLYSVTAYTISQRRREMGIRLALGATSGDVQSLVIAREMRSVVTGILAGLLLSFFSLRLIQSQIWGVSTHDPLTLSAVIGILLVIGVLACFIPSLTATRVDPAETLRSD